MTSLPSLVDLLAQHTARSHAASPAVAAAYQDFIERLQRSEAGHAGPQKGDLLPPFQLPDDHGRLVSSEELLENGPLVVSMNRGQWCTYCRLELSSLQANLEAVSGLGAGIVAISPEIRPYADALRSRCGLTFPVLCDVDNAYALSLGLAIWLGGELKPLLEAVGVDLPLYQGNRSWIVPIPATYVLAPDGRIIDSFVDVDFRKRMAPDAISAALQTARNAG